MVLIIEIEHVIQENAVDWKNVWLIFLHLPYFKMKPRNALCQTAKMEAGVNGLIGQIALYHVDLLEVLIDQELAITHHLKMVESIAL